MPGNAILLTERNVRRSAAPPEELRRAGIYEPSSSAAGISVILSGTPIGGSPWTLAADLVIDMKTEGSRYIAIHHIADEYGIGATPEEALGDLLTSLVDYRAWLEKRQGRLADQEQQALAWLQMVLKRQ